MGLLSDLAGDWRRMRDASPWYTVGIGLFATLFGVILGLWAGDMTAALPAIGAGLGSLVGGGARVVAARRRRDSG